MAQRIRKDRVLVRRPDGDANRLRSAEGVQRPDDDALAQELLEQRPPAADVDEEEVAERRAGRLEPVLAQGGLELRASHRVRRAPPDELGVVPEARDGRGLRGRRDVERPPDLARRRGDVGRRNPVPDAQPREPVDLRERPQHDEPAAGLEQLRDAVGVVGIVHVLEVRLVEHDEHVLGHAVEEGEQLGTPVRRAGRVVRMTDVDELRARPDRGEQAVEVVRVVAQRHPPRHRAKFDRVEDITRERRPAADDLVVRLERCLGDHRVGPRGHDHLLEGDAVQLGQGGPQRVRRPVRVAVQLPREPLDRLDGGRERRERAFVRGELDDSREPQLALHLLDGLAGLVRDDVRDRAAEQPVAHPALLSPPRFLRQKNTAPPTAASAPAATPPVRALGATPCAFFFAARFPAFRTTQPITALRLLRMAI